MNNSPVLQSSLGRVTNNSTRYDRKNSNSIAIGRVTNVHLKRHTADVELLTAGGSISSSSSSEGKYSCRICTSSAGFSTTMNKAFGTITPLAVGTLVVVAFVEMSKEKPIIIGTLFDDSELTGEANSKTILDDVYASSGILSKTDLERYTSITPSQDFITIDGTGNFEVASHTGAFFTGQNKKLIDEDTFGFEDLSVSNADRTTRTAKDIFNGKMKFIAAAKTVLGYIKAMVNASTGAFKIFRQEESTASIIQIDDKGEISFRRHLDTKFSDVEESNKYTEIKITNEGVVEISVNNENPTKLKITPDSVEIDTRNNIKIKADKQIDLETLSNLSIKADSLDIVSSRATLNNKKLASEGDSTSSGSTIQVINQ